MESMLRIELLVLAAVVFIIIYKGIIKNSVDVNHSLIWLGMAVILVIVAIFPDISVFLCNLLSIKTPSNLMFFFGIFILLLISFSHSKQLSKQSEQSKRLIQIVSINRYLEENNFPKEQIYPDDHSK